jgi:hypothetical protein
MRVCILATGLLVLSLSALSAEEKQPPPGFAQSDPRAQGPQAPPDQAVPRERADREAGRDGERNFRDGNDRDVERDRDRDRRDADRDRGDRRDIGDRGRDRGDRDWDRRDRGGQDDGFEGVRPRHRVKICVEQDNGDEVCRYRR